MSMEMVTAGMAIQPKSTRLGVMMQSAAAMDGDCDDRIQLLWQQKILRCDGHFDEGMFTTLFMDEDGDPMEIPTVTAGNATLY